MQRDLVTVFSAFAGLIKFTNYFRHSCCSWIFARSLCRRR